MSETWLINETPKIAPFSKNTSITINFKTNNTNYEYIAFQKTNHPDYMDGVIISYSAPQIYAYDPSGSPAWDNEAYKTIEFETAPTGDLLAWLQANGTKQATPTTKQQIDLSTLSGWASLASGSHQITVKAKASGYADSSSSNAVSVEKAASGYTLTVGSISKTDNPDGPAMNDFGTLTLFKNGSTTGEVVDLINLQNSNILAQGVTSIKFTYEASSGRFGNSSCSISSIKLGGTLSMGTVYQVTENIDDIIIATTSKADAPTD